MNDFKKSVLKSLIDRGMNLSDLAKELNISKSYLSDILNLKRCNTEQIERIKGYLGICDGKTIS